MKNWTKNPLTIAEAVASAAVATVHDLNIDLIICLTDTGLMGRLVAKYRPPCPILACSVVGSVVRNLNTTRGIWAHKIPSY